MKRVFENTETKTVVTNIFNKEDEKMVEHLLRKMIGVGEDVELDDNLKETPHRVLKLWTEMTEGYREDPAKHLEKSFPINSPNLADDEDGFDSKHIPQRYCCSFYRCLVKLLSSSCTNALQSRCCIYSRPESCRAFKDCTYSKSIW